MNVDEQRLCTAYPLLSFLSDEQLNMIDLNVLWMPSKDDQAIIHALSATLNKHVVVYNPGYEPRKGHLCRMILAAVLAPHQIDEVQAVERKLAAKNKIVVVYEKPVAFNPNF